MKLSWTSLKISIAGAKLSHLVQKDKIWDHGSMAEQARIIFYLVQKAKKNENIESLKKHVTISCFEKLQKQFEKLERHDEEWQRQNLAITELAIISVQPGKKNKPDMFAALIKGYNRNAGDERFDDGDHSNKFSTEWFFVRLGEWWMLDEIK